MKSEFLAQRTIALEIPILIHSNALNKLVRNDIETVGQAILIRSVGFEYLRVDLLPWNRAQGNAFAVYSAITIACKKKKIG